MNARRGWVAVHEGTEQEISFVGTDECSNAEDALQCFRRALADHFDIYFRTEDGQLWEVEDESVESDFPGSE